MNIRHPKSAAIALLTAMAVSSATVAEELSYDFVDISYGLATDDSAGIDVDADSIIVKGSYSVHPKIAIFASYENIAVDPLLGVEAESDTAAIGVTVHNSIKEGTSVSFDFAVVRIESEITTTTPPLVAELNDTGNLFGMGFRTLITDQIELFLDATRTYVFDDSSTETSLGLRFYAIDALSVGSTVSVDNDTTTIRLSVRQDF